MGDTIFISYRRGEDSGAAGRLYDRLEDTFGPERLFMDVDNIPPGEDFVRVLEGQVAACDVLLALIGRGWLTATDDAGEWRIANPDDFVRIEIASGLAQGKRVIPVLVNDAKMPRASELPQDLVALVRRQAVRIVHDRFRDDAERLARILEKALADAEARRNAAEEEERRRREREEAEEARANADEEEPPAQEEKSAPVHAKAGNTKKLLALAFWTMCGVGLAELLPSGVSSCFELGDSARAACYRKGAEQGDADAQLLLGNMYAAGTGVAKDDVEAVQWYRKAADQGNAAAQNNLGRMYEDGRGVAKDDSQAVQWYRKAADQGHSVAQYNLGLVYANGEGVADDAQAVQWFRKAAENGQAGAQNRLGEMYREGRGVAKDDAQAVQWFWKSAQQGNAGAQGNLGVMYETGRGVTKDDAQAMQWYRKAADQGDAAALYRLIVLPDPPQE